MHEDNAQDANQQYPLRGVVLCSTSLTQDVRTELSNIATNMGAIHRLDLTTDVTHLIVGQVDTPKYKHVAKERPDIVVLQPEWIDEMRDAWMAAGSVGVEGLFERHRLPAFSGLQICVTGFDNLEQRQQLQDTIASNGATYHGDLTKAVTHLVAARPQGPKYVRAKTWGIKIVSLKWFEESLERGMVLDEALYDPWVPTEEQGRGAFSRNYVGTTLGKRSHANAEIALGDENGKRKMRRTASARLSSQSQNLWADMSAQGDIKDGQEDDQWKEEGMSNDQAARTSVRTDILPPAAALLPTEDLSSRPSSRHLEAQVSVLPSGLLSGTTCLMHGFENRLRNKIAEILEENGARIPSSILELNRAKDDPEVTTTVLIVPSALTAGNASLVQSVSAGVWIVTEIWLERCVLFKTVLDPQLDLLSRHHLDLPSDCMKGMTIASSGMGREILYLSKVIAIAGGSYAEDLQAHISVLIIPSLKGANTIKLNYAHDKDIPIVKADWLLESIAQGLRLPFEDYTLVGRTRDFDENKASPTSVKRRDEAASKRLSATRKRSVTPALHLVKTRPQTAGPRSKLHNAPMAAKRGPFLEDDASGDEDNFLVNDAQVDGGRSQPLQERAHNISSPPKKPSDTSSTKHKQIHSPAHLVVDDTSPGADTEARINDQDEKENSQTLRNERSHDGGAQEPVSEDAAVKVTDQARLQGDIESLLARQHSAASTTDPERQKRRRKERKLGRAASLMSNPSEPTSFGRIGSMEIADSAATASPFDLLGPDAPPLPSQQIGYETADAQEHRARLSKQMGTKFDDQGVGVRVESIGLVKDADTSKGVGARVRGRHRSAKR